MRLSTKFHHYRYTKTDYSTVEPYELRWMSELARPAEPSITGKPHSQPPLAPADKAEVPNIRCDMDVLLLPIARAVGSYTHAESAGHTPSQGSDFLSLSYVVLARGNVMIGKSPLN
jgi:hypothetical protein